MTGSKSEGEGRRQKRKIHGLRGEMVDRSREWKVL